MPGQPERHPAPIQPRHRVRRGRARARPRSRAAAAQDRRDIVKERGIDPAKIAAIEDAETKASQERIEKATEKAKLDKAKTAPEAVTEDLETVQALELAFETDVKDIGAAGRRRRRGGDDLHARIVAAAEVMVEKTAEAAARGADAGGGQGELASPGDDATLGLGAFGDDEIAVLKARLQQEAEIPRDKARVRRKPPSASSCRWRRRREGQEGQGGCQGGG